jgi:hypothetical protein
MPRHRNGGKRGVALLAGVDSKRPGRRLNRDVRRGVARGRRRSASSGRREQGVEIDVARKMRGEPGGAGATMKFTVNRNGARRGARTIVE